MLRREKPKLKLGKAIRALNPIALVVVIVWAWLPLRGEQGLAGVRGRVRDSQGAPVPEATVTARNVATGLIESTRTGTGGVFEIPRLVPGVYQMEARQGENGSAGSLQQELRAGEPVTVELVLQPGSAPQSAPRASRPAEIGSLATAAQQINESQLVGLPLNGRSYSQLATLQAGVTDTSGAATSRGVGGGSLTVSGGRSTSNNFLLDGTNIMDPNNQVPRSAAGVQLGSDAVFQVQVFSGHYGAEYGRGSGGVLNSITRSGTPQFHGTLFEYLRNSALDARNFFDPGAEPPPFKRNQFGFTLTGPVRKEKTFFLASLEVLRDRLSETQVDHFPDEQARLGFPDANGNPTVPVHPAVRPYLDLYPVPNSVRLRGGIGENRATVFLPTNEIFLTTRVDHKLSDRDSFFVRYTFDDTTSTNTGSAVLFREGADSRQQYLTLVGTHIFSLSALTAVRLGYTRPTSFQDTLSAIEIPRRLFFVPGAFKFGILQVPGLSDFGPENNHPSTRITNTFQFSSDTLVQRGPHALKWGAEVHRYRWDSNDYNGIGGQWSFNSLESFLQGGPAGTNVVAALPGSDKSHAYRQTLLGLYFQDTYSLRSNFQLSLGLRYEFTTLLYDRTGKTAYLPDPWQDSEARLGSLLEHNPSGKSFAPRVGITWAPGNRRHTILSWGFGLYHDPVLRYVLQGRDASAPYYRRGAGTNMNATPFLQDGFLNAAAAVEGVSFDVRALDYRHPRVPLVMRYTFSLQQQLPQGWRVQTAYVGARGNHLFRGYESNLFPFPVRRSDGTLFFPPDVGPVNPAFSSGADISSMDAQSFFNALQLSGGKTLSRGLSLQASYSYSKSVDDSSTPGGEGQFGLERTLNRALSDFDIRSRLSLNFFYAPPIGSGRRWWQSGVLAQAFGGWRLGGILSLRAGTPFTARVSVRTPRYLFSATQPDLLPGRSNNPTAGRTEGCLDPRTGQPIVEAGYRLGGPDLYFDPCSFAVPVPGTIGTVGRNTLIAPGVFNVDVSLQREFALDSKRRFQFRAEFFNVPNRANFGRALNGVFTGAFPGRPNPTAGRINSTVTTSRQIQFALRFSF